MSESGSDYVRGLPAPREAPQRANVAYAPPQDGQGKLPSRFRTRVKGFNGRVCSVPSP